MQVPTVAVVAKGLTHWSVAPAFVGSSPIDRPFSLITLFISYAVVVERQTHHLEGVALTRRAGSNPADRILEETLVHQGFFLFYIK